jgi:hypothetical protein
VNPVLRRDGEKTIHDSIKTARIEGEDAAAVSENEFRLGPA